MLEGYKVEDEHNPDAIRILEENGFTGIVRMPRLALYDFEAKKEKSGETAYVEFRCRSPDKAPLFIFKQSKLRRLKELRDATGREVYILLLRRPMYRLFRLEELSTKMKPFNIVISGKKSIPAFRFPVEGELSEEEKKKIMELREEGETQREIADTVGCTELTVRDVLKSPEKVNAQVGKTSKERVKDKKEREKTNLNKTITVKVDQDLYSWLHEAQGQLFLDDTSSTVRFLLRLMQYLVESGQIGIPDHFQLKEFMEFIQNRQPQTQQSPQRSDDIPP